MTGQLDYSGMSTTELAKAKTDVVAQKARVLLRLAEYVRTHLADKPDEAILFSETAAVITDRPTGLYWEFLLESVERLELVEDALAYQNRAAELSIVNTEIAATLWALLNGSRAYCQRCIDSLPGEPHEIAAKAGGRDTCERHMARAS